MYKTKLQELCQQRKWSLPEYSTAKQGLDHNPSFSATVLVNDQSFHTMAFSKSSKEAQNDAARLAFEHFSLPDPNPNPNPNPNPKPNPRPPLPSSTSFPQPSLLSYSGSGAIRDIEGIHATIPTLQQQIQETHQTVPFVDNTSSVNLQVTGSTSIVQGGNKPKDVQHFCKSELQIYAQKRNLVFPVYSSEREGPPHASRFKCTVTVDGKTYGSPEYFPTLKEAEHAAAKVALVSLSPDCIQKDDSAFYKNLLQELVQKEGLHLPTYYTNRSGEAHSPVFVSNVEIEGENFTGQVAKSKKHAEMSAAKVAYNALKERRSSQTPIILSPSRQEQQASKLLSSCVPSNTSANLHQRVRADAPILQAKNHKGEGGSSSSEPSYCCTPDAFPSAPYEPRRDSSLPSSNCSSNLDSDLSLKPSIPRTSLSYKRITVYPANKLIPDGSILLPMRDDNWVAFVPPEATS